MKKVYYSTAFMKFYNPNTNKYYETRTEAEAATEDLKAELKEKKRIERLQEKMRLHKEKMQLNKTVTFVTDTASYDRLYDEAIMAGKTVSEYMRDMLKEHWEGNNGTQTEEL